MRQALALAWFRLRHWRCRGVRWVHPPATPGTLHAAGWYCPADGEGVAVFTARLRPAGLARLHREAPRAEITDAPSHPEAETGYCLAQVPGFDGEEQ